MMNQSGIDSAQRLAQLGTLHYQACQLPLSEREWGLLERLLKQVQYDHIIGGDADERHSARVARFVNDVTVPTSLNRFTDAVKRIVMSEKMLAFYSCFTGTDVLCLRRCQANLLMPGDFIGLHKDQDSNPDYVATVVFHFDTAYDGGDFVTHHPDHGLCSYHPQGRSVLVNNCEIPHEVTEVARGNRYTLACFLSREFGTSPHSRKEFRLSN